MGVFIVAVLVTVPHHLPCIVLLSLRRLRRCKCMQIYTVFRTPYLCKQHCCVIVSSVLESSFVTWFLAHLFCESYRSLHHKSWYANFRFCKRLAGLCYTDVCENTRQYSRTLYTRYSHADLA